MMTIQLPTEGDANVSAIAPAGTVQAGTIYVTTTAGADSAGSVLVVKPGGTRPSSTIPVGNNPCSAVVAPMGTPNAGTLYVADCGDNTVAIIAPGSSKAKSISLDKVIGGIDVVPAGVTGAGTIVTGQVL